MKMTEKVTKLLKENEILRKVQVCYQNDTPQERVIDHGMIKLERFEELFPSMSDKPGKNNKTCALMITPHHQYTLESYNVEKDQIIDVFVKILDQLKILHECGYVHNSLDLNNIFIDVDNNGYQYVSLSDFENCSKLYDKSGVHIQYKDR